MLKLKFGPFAESYMNDPMNSKDFNQALQQFGINVVKEGHNVSFCEIHRPLEQGPVIAWDRRATSLLTPQARERGEEDDNVIGYCIPSLALEPEKSIALENYDYGEQGYLKSKKPVEVISPFIWWHLLCKPWTKDIKREPDKNRDIRASFLGTTYYPTVPWTSRHRFQMVKAWPHKGTYAVFNGQVENNRAFDQEQHYSIMQRSRIVVSPFGISEYCIRDYEAILSGSILVKPEQSRINIYENPWEMGTTVYCRRDWSDLDDALEAAEELFIETTELREENRRNLFATGRNISRFALLFSVAIHNIMKANL